MGRFTLLYRFSTDYGSTWVDFTDQVDSRQTVITHNLCTNNFTSAKDEATFVMPETRLFDSNGNATPKKQLMDALLGTADVLIEIYAPGEVEVLWEDDNALWENVNALWRGSVIRFTGYADRSAINLRSYPLPPSLTVKVQDTSVLHLDDKVGKHLLYESTDNDHYTIKRIVRNLLTEAGYVATDTSLSDSDTTVMSSTDNVQLEAFVVDKDDTKTYRNYIDTLLFEAGGYVIDFNEQGLPVLVHLAWDGTAASARTIDNPMNSSGVQMKGAWLKEDGAKVTWSTLAWSGEGQTIYQSDISQEIDNGMLVGDTVSPFSYWPTDGDVAPVYMEYDAKFLDKAYLTRESRKQNEDLSIIMAKGVYARMDALRNGNPFTSWTYVDPTGWSFNNEPETAQQKYGLNTNPQIYPKKAWYLLYNNTADDINLTFFTLYGNVLYRSRINTLETSGASNPKEYESTYIYDENQAKRFTQFWWHFLQTSRYQFTWSEPKVNDPLNEVVTLSVKGNNATQKALIVQRTSKWINDNVEVCSFTAVGIEAYVAKTLVAQTVLSSSSKAVVQTTRSNVVTATFSTPPVYTLAEWEAYGTLGAQQTWTVTNPTPETTFPVGCVALINGKISDMDNLDVQLYMTVTGADDNTMTITGTGIQIKYTPVTYQWDFTLSRDSVTRNLRDATQTNLNDTIVTAIISGYSYTPTFHVTGGTGVEFTDNHLNYITATSATIRIPQTQDYDTITVVMDKGPASLVKEMTKVMTVVDITEYNHNYGVWTSSTLPTTGDFVDENNTQMLVIEGDFFVAGLVNGNATWTGNDGNTYTSGVPYEYKNGSWHNPMSANDPDTARNMLGALANVLGDTTVQPTAASLSAIYAWFENLTAKTAVIENLFSQAITILNGGYIKGGSRYDSSGNVDDWSKKGFWFSYDGTLKASLQSDDNGNTFVGTGISSTSTSTGSYNTALGYQAMHSNVSGGDYNVGIGYEALNSATTGDYNIGIGYDALFMMQSSSYNIGIGYEALYNATGDKNIALGYQALDSVTLGENNIGIGANASVYSSTGSNQMSFNNSLLYLEFKSTRTRADVYNTLVSYYSTIRSVGCMGNWGDYAIVGVYISNNKIKLLRLYSGSTSPTLSQIEFTASDTTSLGSMMSLFIVNPNIGNRDDCLS